MLPQYKMVLLNSILSAILLLSLIIIKYIFKRKINLFYLLISISILPIISIFRAGVYESGDLSQHVKNLMSFYDLLINHRLIPRWAPEFNAGYGDPYFIYIYFLPYLIGSIFHIIGFSFLMSLKLLLAFSFVISGVTMYFWVKEELGKKSGFVSALFYLFTPYHLIDLHFRAAVAENLSFIFLPIILLGIKKSIENNSKRWFVILSMSTGLLILSHQAISIMFLPIMIGYSVFTWIRKNNRKYNNLISCFISMILGFLLTSFYWIPVVFLAKFTQQGLNPSPISFPSLSQLLYSPWRFGFLFQGHKGELSYLIGYTQLLIILLSACLFFKNIFNEKLKNFLAFFLIIFIILCIMMFSATERIWKIIPFLEYSQFSTRLLVPLTLCISIIAGIVVKKIKNNRLIVALCFFTIIYTILNWGNRRTIPTITDDYLKKEFGFKHDIANLEATFPIWVKLDKYNPITAPKSNIEILNGNAVIKEISRTPISHTYNINAQSDVLIKENTFFFPGWIVFGNNKQIQINYRNPKYPGIITFNLTPGIYDISVKFVDLPIITFSKWLSGLSFFGMLIYIFIPKKLNFPKL